MAHSRDLTLNGMRGVKDVFTLAAAAQNLRKPAKFKPMGPAFEQEGTSTFDIPIYQRADANRSLAKEPFFNAIGLGRCYVDCGVGSDRLVFTSTAQSRSAERDVVTDFALGQAQTILTGAQADVAAPGIQGFTFTGSAAFNAAGDLRFLRPIGWMSLCQWMSTPMDRRISRWG